jgi:hypothetical protein
MDMAARGYGSFHGTKVGPVPHAENKLLYYQMKYIKIIGNSKSGWIWQQGVMAPFMEQRGDQFFLSFLGWGETKSTWYVGH